VVAALLVDLTEDVLFACFLTPDFFAVLFTVLAEVVEAVAGAFAGAGAVCAKSDTPASAMVIVIPIIA
jgi:hypothetical protein